MKFSFEISSNYRETRICAEPGEYDGNPLIREVVFHYAPHHISADAKALICYLLFQNYLGSEFESPEPCSPYLAEVISKLHGQRLNVVQVSSQAMPIQRSGQTVVLVNRSVAAKIIADLLPQYHQVAVEKDAAAGQFISKNKSILFSNASMLAANSDLSRIVNDLTSVILMAEDLLYDCVVLPVTFCSYQLGMSQEYLANLQHAFACVDLRLEMPTRGVSNIALDKLASSLPHPPYEEVPEEIYLRQSIATDDEALLMSNFEKTIAVSSAKPHSTAPVIDFLENAMSTLESSDSEKFISTAKALLSQYHRNL